VCDGNGNCVSTCNASNCETCDGNGNCVYTCDPNSCELCDGEGNCLYTCDPNSCEVCDGEGNCVSTCDPNSCEVCDGEGNCVSTCDPNSCEVCDGEGNCVSTCDPNSCEVCDGEGNCVSTCDPNSCEVCDGEGNCVSRCGECEECDGQGNCECNVEIASINLNSDYACLGSNVTFTAITNPTGKCSCVNWSGGGNPSSQEGGCTFTTSWDSTGIKTVTASIDGCSSSKQKQVTVVKVEITNPQYLASNPSDSSGRYVFSDRTDPDPNTCTIIASGTTGVPALDAGLQWSISTISGSTLTYDPDTMQGPSMTFSYTNLPSSLSNFGVKTITLTHPQLPSGCNTDTQNIEVYFSFAAKNWPGAAPMSHPQNPSSPKYWTYCWNNWYYYYKQTEAHVGCLFTHDGSQCSSNDNPDYTPYVGSMSNPHSVLTYTHPCGSEIKNSGDILYGIDVFGWASRHEMKHHNDYTSWWGAGGVVAADDLDNDKVRDNLEASFPCNDGGPYDPTKQNTYEDSGFWYGWDDQTECMFTQDTWVKETHQSIDWAFPGSRWH